MSDYKKLVEGVLNKIKNNATLNEGISYPEGMTERMDSVLEAELKSQNHSLGKHPIFPEGDECSFEEKIMLERFSNVVKQYKRAHDVDSVNVNSVKKEMLPLVYETMGIEAKHKKELVELAVKMVREEYDMGDDIVDIDAKIVNKITMDGLVKNIKPTTAEGVQFESHDEIVSANEEVYKRRFINAMIQGAAKKCNHMFHMIDEELTNIDPRLPNKYSKMMSSADYMYYVIPKMEKGFTGGMVRVDFDGGKPKIIAEAITLPVLIHELVKGVMEILSAHGLPKDKMIGEYVIGKADFLAAEPWDMRLGPALWERFTAMIEPDDFHLKHHIYSELVSLPVKEFNVKMREIMGGTNSGKKIIKDIVDDVKNDLKDDDFNTAMSELSITPKNSDDNDGFSWDDIDPNGDDDDGGFDWDDINPFI